MLSGEISTKFIISHDFNDTVLYLNFNMLYVKIENDSRVVIPSYYDVCIAFSLSFCLMHLNTSMNFVLDVHIIRLVFLLFVINCNSTILNFKNNSSDDLLCSSITPLIGDIHFYIDLASDYNNLF